jgi:hypothetical protein
MSTPGIHFREWLLESEEAERTSSFEQYSKALNDLYTRYGSSVSSVYLDHERKTFMTMPLEDLRREMANLPKFLKDQERDLERKKQDLERQSKRDDEALETKREAYYRAENSYERVVCSRGDPGYAKNGMEAYPMDQIDPELKGYYGIHVGGGWLPILKRDGYCDSGDAYQFTIHADEMNEDGIEVYEMDDPHVAYRDSQTPESQIVFCKLQRFPAKYIEQGRVIPEDEIPEARPPDGMDDGGWDNEDDEEEDDY